MTKIIQGDCLEALHGMPDNSIDMIFTDPPYGHSNNDGDLIHNWEAALGRPKPAASEARPIANDKPEEANALVRKFLQKPSGF